MAWPGFPELLDGLAPGLNMGLGVSCTTCAGIPVHQLPSETEDAYPHHLSLDALEKSRESCAMCALIYWAAGCSLVDYGGETRFSNMRLASGARVSTVCAESVRFSFAGVEGLANGAMIFTSRFSAPVADYDPPLQVDLSATYPSGTVAKDGEAKPIRPWLFGNWYKSPVIGNDDLLMVGLGVRLGTSEKVEDALDYDGQSVRLRGSYIRFRTDQDTNLIPGKIRAADAGSSYAFDKLRKWLKICDDFDKCVSLNAPSDLPTRVLDVSAAQDTIFLRETRGQKGNYLALSHSWGSTHRLTLTRENLEVLKGGIQCADIPKTFQDAVKIARELKIAYLWIDSLCIIQDDIGDWEVEASHMGDVYAGSYLTVASLSSKDDSSGCFPEFPTRFDERFVSLDVRSTGRRCFTLAAPVVLWKDGQELPTLLGRNVWATDEVTHKGAHRSWLFMTPEWMPCSTKEDPRPYLLGEFGPSHDPIADEPLSERAWTLQERILAPRTIHYGRTEMYWECQNNVQAEDGALLRRTFTTPKDLWEPTSEETERDRYWHWAQLVEQYSTRKLTRESDKLPALSGLAHLIATKTGDIYLAGLWKSNLLRDLTWSVRTFEPTHLCSDPKHDLGLPPATKSAVK